MRSYWREGPFYDFSMAEIQRLEGAVAQLFEMCVAAGDHVVDNDLFDRLRIPPMARPQIRRTWESEPPSIYGRFDLRYDGEGPPKLLEFNADTPTGLVESAVTQWNWHLFTGQGTRPVERAARQARRRLAAQPAQVGAAHRPPPAGAPGLDQRGDLRRGPDDRRLPDGHRGAGRLRGDRARRRGHRARRRRRPVLRPAGPPPRRRLQALPLGVADRGRVRPRRPRRRHAARRDDVGGAGLQDAVEHQGAAAGAVAAVRQRSRCSGSTCCRPTSPTRCRRRWRDYVRKPLWGREGANVAIVRDGEVAAELPGPLRHRGLRRPGVRAAAGLRRASTARTTRCSAPGWSTASRPAWASGRATG